MLPRALGFLVIGALLSACAVIPSTGPVVSGQVVAADPRDNVFQVLPDGPAHDASAQGIVTGFLRAAVGFSNDHRVARDFLTPQRRLTWRPDAKVSIYPSESTLTMKDAGEPAASAGKPVPTASTASGAAGAAGGQSGVQTTKVTVRTPIEAWIDRDGRYVLAPPGTKMTTTFGLTKVVDGQWRISTLADGIMVRHDDFTGTFRPFPVYFTDPTGRFLVPDLHWFAGTRDDPESRELPTALVRVLLEGPPPWLTGAVSSGAPPGTRMAVAAVVVSGQVATVDLTDQVRSADTRQRQLLLSQLEATLAQLNISAVQITVRRLAFDVPSGSSDSDDPSQAPVQPVADPQVNDRPVVIDSKGRLARLDGRMVGVVKGTGELSKVPGINRPAVSNDSSAYAVLTADRSKLLLQLPGTKVVTLIKSAGLTAPSFDPLGWVWTAPGTNAGWVYAAGLEPGKLKVDAPWLKNYEVISLRISRDGTRAALAVRVHGAAHVFLTGVVRDADGQPRSLNQPIGLIPDLTAVTDLAWVDEDRLVVLGKRSAIEGQRPFVVQIGGGIETSTAVPTAVSIAAGNGPLSLLAGTSGGIDAQSGRLWDRISSAKWPAFPG